MDQRPLVLLCAASGTGLTAITDALRRKEPDANGYRAADPEDDASIAIEDLETTLCESLKGDRRIVNDPEEVPSMADVVRLPRNELYTLWQDCCNTLMAEQAANRKADLRILSLHLTWYDSNTTEFYSPVNTRYLERDDCTIDRVIILIDDIFDMYRRLQGSNDLYGSLLMEYRTALLGELHGINLADPPKDWDDEDVALTRHRLELEAVELAIGHLMSWRHYEMIRAENIARTLDADFTVLATKHSRLALRHLTRTLSVPKTYLSHRISDIRRMNKWTMSKSPIVKEVNRLHLEFAKRAHLLINPTAIDELRFADSASDSRSASALDKETANGTPTDDTSTNGPNDSQDADQDKGARAYAGLQTALLSARWELPEPPSDLLWIDRIKDSDGNEADMDFEHTELLSGGRDPSDPIALSVARSLEARIHEEVAFRDHIIVENTPGLCVYRPFFVVDTRDDQVAVNWSRGVAAEIEHWSEKLRLEREASARIAFVNTRQEIAARIRWITGPGSTQLKFQADSMLRHLFIKWKVPEIEAEAFINGEIRRASPSALARNPVSVTKTPKKIWEWVRAAALVAVTEAFTRLKLDESEPRSTAKGVASIPPENLGMLYVEQNQRGQIEKFDKVSDKLCAFFAGKSSVKDIAKWRKAFWKVHDEEFRNIVGVQPVEFISKLLELPYTELLELCNTDAGGTRGRDDQADQPS